MELMGLFGFVLVILNFSATIDLLDNRRERRPAELLVGGTTFTAFICTLTEKSGLQVLLSTV